MFVCISISNGPKTIVPFHGINVFSSNTIYDLYNDMINGKHGPKFGISDDLKSDVIIDVFVGDKNESCDTHVEH